MRAIISDPAFALAVVAKATLLLSAAGLAALVLSRRRAPAAARHLVWTLAVCGVLALPIFSIALPGWRLGFVRMPRERRDAAPSVLPAPAPLAAATRVELPRITTPQTASTRATEPPVAAPAPGNPVDWGMAIPALYLAGVLLVLARMLVGRWSLRRLAREAVAETGGDWTALLGDLRWAMDVGRPVALLRGAGATMPMTWGTRRPAILLPADAGEWPEDRRRVVLLHELAHVARHDCLTQTLATLACALYWFHPAAWYAARRLRVERELACDDRVLAAGTRAREYAEHLLEVARAFRAPALAAAAAVSMARPSQLEGRMLAVLDTLRRRGTLTRRGATAAAAVALALILPLAAARPGAAAVARATTPSVHPSPASAARVSPASPSSPAAVRAPQCTVMQGSFDCQLPARPGEKLTVEIPNGVTVWVTGWHRDSVSVSTETNRYFDAIAERVAGGVHVRVSRASGWNGSSEADLVIRVPARFDVHAESDNGGVEIRGVEGTFTGSTHGGGLVFEDAAGTVRMSTGGGGASLTHTRLQGQIEMGGGGATMVENTGRLMLPGASSINGINNTIPAVSLLGTAPRVGDDVAPAAALGVAAGSGGRPVAIARSGPIDVRDAPAGAYLDTNDGDIHVGRAGRQVIASTARGDVVVESLDGGSARLQTASGDISVRISEQGGDVEATSAMGTVTVYVPAEFSGELELETAYTREHGPTRIVSDFPVAITESAWDASRGTPTKYVRGRARLGGGRHRVTVRTVNGDVRVVRGGSAGAPARALLGGGDVECGAGCTLNLLGAETPRASMPGWIGGGRVVAAGYTWPSETVEQRIAVTAIIARGTPASAAAAALANIALHDRDERVQTAAVKALAGMEGRESAELLRRIARDHPSAAIRRRASDALR